LDVEQVSEGGVILHRYKSEDGHSYDIVNFNPSFFREVTNGKYNNIHGDSFEKVTYESIRDAYKAKNTYNSGLYGNGKWTEQFISREYKGEAFFPKFGFSIWALANIWFPYKSFTELAPTVPR